jgi:hypothetical protein
VILVDASPNVHNRDVHRNFKHPASEGVYLAGVLNTQNERRDGARRQKAAERTAEACLFVATLRGLQES